VDNDALLNGPKWDVATIETPFRADLDIVAQLVVADFAGEAGAQAA